MKHKKLFKATCGNFNLQLVIVSSFLLMCRGQDGPLLHRLLLGVENKNNEKHLETSERVNELLMLD
jgi:hypothetical protein